MREILDFKNREKILLLKTKKTTAVNIKNESTDAKTERLQKQREKTSFKKN